MPDDIYIAISEKQNLSFVYFYLILVGKSDKGIGSDKDPISYYF